MLDRRRFLATLPLAGTALLFGATRAFAFRPEESTLDQHSLYLSACQRNPYHEQLVQDLEAALAGRPLADAEKESIRQALRCPVCGCPAARS